jgi:hypothetical protein
MKNESLPFLYSLNTPIKCDDITSQVCGGDKKTLNATLSKSSASLLLRSVNFRLVVATVIIGCLWSVLSQLL